MGKTGWKRLLSAFLCVCMVAVMAPTAFAGEDSTIDLDQFIKNVEAANYDYDGQGITVKWSPISGCYDTRENHECTVGNKAATGNTPKRINSSLTQFQIYEGESHAVSIKNVNFVYEPADFTVCINSGWKGTFAADAAPAGQLYLMNTGDVTFEDCTFDKVVVTSFDCTGTTTVKNCEFANVYNNYAIKDVRGENVIVTGNKVTNCGGGVMVSSTNAVSKVTIANNEFTNVDVNDTAPTDKVGTRGLIQIASSGDYSNTTFDFSGNAAENCGPAIRQLNNGQNAKLAAGQLSYLTGVSQLTTGDSKVFNAVAKIGDTVYESLAEAVAAAKAGDTIQLLGDCKTATLKAGVTYDLNGKTLTYTSTMTVTNTVAPTSFIDTSVSDAARGGTLKMTRTASGVAAFTVSAGTTFNVQNIHIESTQCEGIFPLGEAATLNITNCDMKANYYCVGTNAGSLANYGVIINLKGSTFSSMGGTYAVDGTAVYINVSGELNIDDCVLTAPRQALMVRAGTANITNSTLKTTGSYSDKEQYYTGKWGSGNEVPAAALVVGNYVDGEAMSYEADAVVTVENTKLIGENGFPALYVDGNTAYKGDVSISGDKTTVSGAVMKGQNQDNAVISISGGLFNTQFDRSYCTTGLTVVNNNDEATKSTYPYIVGTLPANTENKIDAATDIGDNTVNVDAITNSEDKNAAQDAAEKVKFEEAVADKNEITETDKQRGLTALANENKVQVDSDGKIQGNTTVTIVKEVFFDITVTDFKVRGLADKDVSVTMDITPKYNLIATTDKDNRTDANSVTLETKPLTVSEATKVSVTIPAFANKKVYIDHANGKNLYVATADAYGKIEFTTNGFSPFTFTLSNPNVVAEVNGNAYTSFQDAVNAVANGGTIDIVGGTSYTATINSGDSKTFTVKNTLGSDITVKVNNDSKTVGKNNGTQSFTYTKPSSGGSSGGSSSGKTTYKVTTSAVNNGGVNASPSSAEKGASITITLSPDKGYKLDKLTVTDGSGKTVSTVKKSDTVYTFTMPASAVNVGVSYVKADETPSKTKFNDVSANDWFASAVDYVTGKGMMNGTADNTFSPKANTTRGMVVTVLYRLENQPSTSAASFTDVASGAYYANAVAWANANGIVSGYGSGKFGPNDKVTREQLAAILYRYAQYKKYDVSVGEDTNILSYNDAQSISAYAIPAIQWACGAGVMNGSNGRLTPKSGATRAQAAQLLMNFCENAAK